MVKTKDKEQVDDEGISKKFNSRPCQIVLDLLLQSKSLLNDVLLALDGLKKNKRY